MGDKSAIEWTDATWNVVTGCTKVSPGCANCYIERTPPFRVAGRRFVDGDIPLVKHEDRLELPLRWKRPRRIFVNSLSDMFHPDVPDELIKKMFDVMAQAHWHQFQMLTKREDRLVEWSKGVTWPENVWVGVTAENAHWVEKRGHALLDVDARVRWLSVEPLLDDAADALWDLLKDANGRLHWVVAGYESGPKRRPEKIEEHHREWIRRIRDVCDEFRVAFLFKQWGGLTAKSGGRQLDGRTYDGYPEAR